MEEIVTLDYGSGGKKTSRLIEKHIVPRFENEALNSLGDGAVIPGGRELAFSTDSFVVDPLFFPGGDIGKLAVCGDILRDPAAVKALADYDSVVLVEERESSRIDQIDGEVQQLKTLGKEILGVVLY